MKGLVYKSINLGKIDKIIYLITVNGYTSVLLKKGQSPTSSNIIYSQMLTLLEYSIKQTESEIKKSTKIDLIDDYNEIKSDYEKNKSSQIIIKVITDLFKLNEDFKKIFPLILIFLEHLKKDNLYFYQMIIKLTYFLGIGFTKDNIDDLISSNNFKEVLVDIYKIPFSQIDIKIIEKNKERIINFIKSYYLKYLDYKIIGV